MKDRKKARTLCAKFLKLTADCAPCFEMNMSAEQCSTRLEQFDQVP